MEPTPAQSTGTTTPRISELQSTGASRTAAEPILQNLDLTNQINALTTGGSPTSVPVRFRTLCKNSNRSTG